MVSGSGSFEAFTGLEAAIVLISFVVVAAVFSFVVLGTGFFVTEKSEEVINSGLKETSNSLNLFGTVVAKVKVSDPELRYIMFYLEQCGGGTGIDINKISYEISTDEFIKDFPPGDSSVEYVWKISPDDDNILEDGEILRVRIYPDSVSLAGGDSFKCSVIPSEGHGIFFSRDIPDNLVKNDYYELV
ncbi:archaellin/type IV pilin N-terminal domain-containing protein [Methanoplanus endosymbiosus]|uniref:Flagellin n=1 Tax=Methanoplanus endosymbiosus TaxID=33865 RepID=A0A9E7THU1_9EURY|nr:archaellin/type IV pilin N-terminal domain-containing protein [Methanoplanus endosymbiosus]UUX93582.1 flagellin [Methanoplanus endosymbiosus]